MLKIISIKYNELNDRFEPRFHYYKNLHKRIYDKFGFQKMKDIAKLKSGTTPQHSDAKSKIYNTFFVKSADVKRFNINYTTISYITEEVHLNQRNSKILFSDVLITNTGKYLGFSSIYSSKGEANTNQNNIIIRLKKDIKLDLNPYILSAFFNSNFGQNEIQSILTLTGQKYLNMSKFKELKIPTMSKIFVDALTNELERVYEYEGSALKLLENSKEDIYDLLNIDFSKIKTSKIFSVNLSTFKASDLWMPQYSNPLYINTLKAIQKKFQTVTLGEICSIKKGDEVGSINYIQYIDKKESDIPFIRTTDLVNYECDQFPDFFIPESVFEELQQDVKEGDVLFTKDGKIGMTAMITAFDKLIIASGLIRLRIKPDAFKKYGITQEYLFTVLSLKETGFYPAKRRTVVASTIPHLREDRLKDIEIPILPKDKIDLITKKVKEAFLLKDEKKKLVKKALKDIDEYFEK